MLGFGVAGLWYALIVEEFGMATAMATLWRLRAWQRLKLKETPHEPSARTV